MGSKAWLFVLVGALLVLWLWQYKATVALKEDEIKVRQGGTVWRPDNALTMEPLDSFNADMLFMMGAG